MALNINWAVPEGVNVGHVLQAGFAMMDGIQLRRLRSPPARISTPCGPIARMC